MPSKVNHSCIVVGGEKIMLFSKPWNEVMTKMEGIPIMQGNVQYNILQREKSVGNVDETWPHRLKEEVSPKALSFIN
ncbi:hypothetical protein VNO78_20522 [Psophocarpus tetragonolobus]|uniref:Uncharacterized protein n=1 Tax=Psophocarpus tetragonolobus TaxID=3891 RepID=A0AAN9XH80_PSOTE